jgi:DNA-binding response OmpR family regulator
VFAAEKKYAFDQATVVLFNPLSQMRATLRDAMLVVGFRNILDYGDLERTRTAIIERAPDLVLLDLDREKESVCTLVREVRHSNITADPFVVIIALTWHPSLETVNNSLEAGVDDIITMPISIKLINERIDALIRNRKEFVVTASYVGPDRRTGESARTDPIGLGTIRVPNNLRFKAAGDVEAAASADSVTAVQARINNHRLNRYAQRIAWLIDETLKVKASGNELPAASAKRLDEVAKLTDDLAFDIEVLGQVELLDICDSMVRVIENIRSTPTRQFYELLKVHAFAITATLMETDGAADLVIQALNDATAKLKLARSA